MKLYAIIDEEGNIARNKHLGVFKDLNILEKHAWRYLGRQKKIKVAEFELKDIKEIGETK